MPADLNRHIDHTLLKPTALIQDIEKLCSDARDMNFAAVCVPPLFVRRSAGLLKGSSTAVATVIGFPFGYSAIEAKIAEILLAIVDGAGELDMVINIAALKNGDWEYLANEINHCLPIVHGKECKIKIIIESGVLTDDEIIRCCELYGVAGIDWLKTSTGYAEKGASLHAVELMRKHLPGSVRIKASGGIRDLKTAQQMISAGADRIGTSSGVAIMHELNQTVGQK